MARVDASTGLKPAYSFDQLVIGPNNHVAVAACREVLKAPGEQYNPLFIFGPTGVGKTHLMQAVANEMLQTNPTFKVKYISAERFTNEMVTAISEDRVVEIRRTYSQLDLLIVDDVQYLTESKIAQEELFHIFNNMHQEGRQAILAADRPPNQLVNLSTGIKSRLEWGLATDIKVPDEPTRLEILRKKQTAQGLGIPDEMLALVAQSLKSNVRELEGFLKRMHAYVTLSHQEISMDLVKAVLKELVPTESGPAEPTAPFLPPNESPAPPPTAAPGVAPEVSTFLNGNGASNGNGSTNGNGNTNGNGHSNGNGFNNGNGHTNGNGKFGSEKKPGLPSFGGGQQNVPPRETAPAPSSDTFDQLLSAMDMGVLAAPGVPAPKDGFDSPPPPPDKDAPPARASTSWPAALPPSAPEPIVAPVPVIDIPEVVLAAEEEDMPSGHKEVGAVFFFPEGGNEALETVHRKFQEVIKKHKLKFRLKRVHNESYAFKGKINYTNFVNVCKANKVPVAIVIGPPPDTFIPEQDFYDLLTVTLDVQGVSLQLVNWGEINKDYRYLNLALDIALVRSR